jgi:dienelactone hydrolase
MKTISIRIVQILFFLPLLYQNGTAQIISQGSAWQKIAPYFSVPDQFKDQFGTYTSPLEFYDRRPVKNPADWKNRRAEILDRWHGMMGKWPALITNQKFEILDSTRMEGFTRYRVRFSWIPGQKTTGYLMIPDGKGKKPAVITVYYEPETAAGLGRADLPDRDFAYQLCKRGFVTLSIGTTETTNSKTYALYYPDIQNASVQPLSMLAYAAANAWNVLAKVQNVDSKRIGIMGHSYGGKWAMFASCLYEKFACAVWSDPGIVFEDSRESINYWEPWYLGYHPQPWRKRGLITKENPAIGLYPKLVTEGYNLQELHALMAPRPFLVSGGSEDRADRWIPLNHSVAVNNLLGYKNRVAMTNRPEHTPNPESNELAFEFFEYFLK